MGVPGQVRPAGAGTRPPKGPAWKSSFWEHLPVLSISLDPGESVVAETGEFSWMTDSIQMSAGGRPLSHS